MEDAKIVHYYGNWSRVETMKNINQNVEPTIDNFVAAFKTGIDAWELAGKILVMLRKEDGAVFEKITASYPFISSDSLEVFYHIGTKSLHPAAVLLPRHIFTAVRGMGYETQKNLLENSKPITIVTHLNGEKAVTVAKPLLKLTVQDARSALGVSGQVSIEQQAKKITKKTEEIKQKIPPINFEELRRIPVSRGLYIIRRTPSGSYAFERTTSRPYNLQTIRLENGQAVVELKEFPNTKNEEE